MPNSFATWLKETRESRGMSKRALESASGVSSAMLTLLEQGERNPSRDMVRKLAAGMEVSDAGGLTAAGFIPPDPEIVAEPDPDMTYIAASYSGMTRDQKDIILGMVKALRTADRRRGLGGKDDVSDEGDGDDDGDIDEADK